MAVAEIASKAENKAVDRVASAFKKSNTTPAKTSTSTIKRKNEKSAQSRKENQKHERRVAHRYVERRRRSKMNDEFTTLRDLIPTCEGQVMQKLAILQVYTSGLYLM
jgi:helix-loop-helix DNA-binding protein